MRISPALASCAALAFIAAPATAMAATHPAAKPHPRAPHTTRHFTAHGLIVSHTRGTATVLATTLRDGRLVRKNVRITVALPHTHARGSRGHALAPLADGDVVNLSGSSSSGSGPEQYVATGVGESAAPAHAFLGTISAVNGSMITVTKAGVSSDEQQGSSDEGAPDGPGSPGQNGPEDRGRGEGGGGPRGGGFTVDVSEAQVMLDFANGGTLAPGQFVAILGEGDHDTLVAQAVFAFSVAPAVLSGEVSAVSGSVVTIDQDGTSSTVDLADAQVFMNGNPNGSPTEGSRLVLLGTTDGSGNFSPSLAFGFDGHDRGPVGEND